MNTATIGLLRRSCAAVLLLRVREYGGVLALDSGIHAKWAAFNLTPAQIEQAAHDLEAAGDATLTTAPDGVLIITAGGAA